MRQGKTVLFLPVVPFFVTRCQSLSLAVSRCYSFSLVVPLVVTHCQSLSVDMTRCHLLWLVIIRWTTRYHSFSLFVIRCHSLYHLLSLVVIRYHLLSLDVPYVCLFINDRCVFRFLSYWILFLIEVHLTSYNAQWHMPNDLLNAGAHLLTKCTCS